jgi:hemoglobin-like flavoprotein
MLDTATIEIVEESWAKAAGAGAETVGVLLFKNIFTIAPDALEIFVSFKDEPDLYTSPKLMAHGVNVVTTVGTALSFLRDLDTLVPMLQQLGSKHVAYGVLPRHYEVLGQALMQTLKMGLGDEYTEETEDAWRAIYGVIATTMMGDHYS